MGKPKENTIGKIDLLTQKVLCKEISPHHKNLALALKKRCHTMDIHRAKLAYFKQIKVGLTQLLALAETQKSSTAAEYQALEKELQGLLNANNG